MRFYETFLEGVVDILETALGMPVQIGFETELENWMLMNAGEVTAFLAYSGFEKIGSLERGHATVSHEFTLYLRKIKLEAMGIPEKIASLVEIIEEFDPVEFRAQRSHYHLEIESGSVDMLSGEIIFRIPIKVYKVG
ncbi:MAG: hypothetical protein N2560_08760 [Ignavibacteria bacterium]|nr:hypothetical protein [Ignavibacteria bacterium]